MSDGEREAPSEGTSRWIACVLIGVASLACGPLLGVDEYTVARGGVPVPDVCGPTGVPGSNGSCEPVGVNEHGGCPSGSAFSGGGCVATLPAEPCPMGGREVLGASKCEDFTILCSQGRFPAVPASVSVNAVEYVDGSDKGTASDGSESAPWHKIGDALDAVLPGGAVLVAEGDYSEDLVIAREGVQLRGICPSRVRVTGTGAKPPNGWPCGDGDVTATLCVPPAGAGAILDSLVFTGAGDGLAVVGAERVSLNLIAVDSPGRYGVRIEALTTVGGQLPAAAEIRFMTIAGAHGNGLYVAGAEVVATDLTVRQTERLYEYLGYGVAVRPGGAGIVDPNTTVSGWARSEVTLDRVLLFGSAEAGLLVSGSTARVTDSYIGSFASAEPRGKGIIVEREVPRGYSADLQMSHSIVERTEDAAITVDSATVVLEDVAIQDTLGRASDGCSGQGIRARTARGTQADVTLRRSLVRGSKQAAVHAHGALVTVDHSILRGSAPGDAADTCSAHLGDGVTLETIDRAETRLSLTSSRIDGNSRAAIASLGGTVNAQRSVLACNGRGIVAAKPRLTVDGTTRCSTRAANRPETDCTTLQACAADGAALEGWVSPGAASGHGVAVTDFETSVETYGVKAALTNGMAWLLEAPEVAPSFPDRVGCATLRGVPELPRRRVAIWDEEQFAVVAQVADSTTLSCAAGLETGQSNTASAYTPNGITDLNRGIVFVTAMRSAATIVQSPESGSPWAAVGAAPVKGNIEPGWHTFEIAGMECRDEVTFSGLSVPGRPGAVSVLVEPGMIVNVNFARCVPPSLCADGFPDPISPGACLSGTAAGDACVTEITRLAKGTANQYPPSCAACLCERCLREWSACTSEPGCRRLLECAVPAGCHGVACLSACPTELEASGGPGSVGVSRAGAVDNCGLASGCSDCVFP